MQFPSPNILNFSQNSSKPQQERSLTKTSQISPNFILQWLTYKNFPFVTDFLCGAIAGISSGTLVAPVQYIKVVCQDTKPSQLKQVLRSKQTGRNIIKSIIPFSFTFGGVCALEFSVNHRIGEAYGKLCGIVASAITGALFLTPADHLMFRRHNQGENTFKALNTLYKIRPNALWTGFSPMIARQAIFISSVMHLGPLLGNRLRLLGGSKESIVWSSIGRVITGVITTLISQPFDTMAREMQKMIKDNPSKKPTIKMCLAQLKQEYKNNPTQYKLSHPLFRGATARIGLATFGGVLAGGIFDWLKQYFNEKNEGQL